MWPIMIPQPKLLPFRAPCTRCGRIRPLSESDGLCWAPDPEELWHHEISCWHGRRHAALQDEAQDAAARLGDWRRDWADTVVA